MKYLMLGLATFASSVLALWAVDIGVNLGLVEKLILHGAVPLTWLDVVGVLIAETQVALFAVLLAWMLGPMLARLTRSRDTAMEVILVLQAGIVALVVLAGTRVAWGFTPAQIKTSLTISALLGVVSWIALRWGVFRKTTRQWSFGDIAALLSHTALLVGFANLLLAQISRGRIEGAMISLLITAVLIAAVVAAMGRVPFTWRVAARWAPLAVIVWVSVHSILLFENYGKPDHVNELTGEYRPNIVLIVLDTVRADHLKTYGYARDTMPALERWAVGALTAKRAVSPAGWTAPSHASLFSGRPVSLHGVHYSSSARSFQTSAHEGIDWLPARLSQRGYYCLAVSANTVAVSHEVAGFDRVLVPARKGWVFDSIAGLVDHMSPLLQILNERLRWRMPYVDAAGIVNITMRAVPQGDGPVFLFVNLLDAHGPYNPSASAEKAMGVSPPHLYNRYLSNIALNKRWRGLPEEKVQALVDLYDAEMRGMDVELDRLLGWIDERLGEDTIVIVTSDHGEELGESDRVGHAFGLSQALIHVPLFIRSPGLPTGDLDSLVNVRAAYDFILRVAEGQDIGVETLTEPDEFGFVSERYPCAINIRDRGPEYGRAWVALFDGDLKSVGPAEFGLENYTLDDRFAASEAWTQDTHTRLEDRIEAYWEAYRDPRVPDDARPLTEDELDRLRSLGYVK